jgi:hypothetical protein
VPGFRILFPYRVAPLRGIRTGLRASRRSMPNALKVATVVCLVLLALLAVIQVTHVHATDSDADHCTLCVAMHSVVPIVIMLVTVVLISIEVPALGPLEVRVVTRYWQPTLFVRPPPAGC